MKNQPKSVAVSRVLHPSKLDIAKNVGDIVNIWILDITLATINVDKRWYNYYRPWSEGDNNLPLGGIRKFWYGNLHSPYSFPRVATGNGILGYWINWNLDIGTLVAPQLSVFAAADKAGRADTNVFKSGYRDIRPPSAGVTTWWVRASGFPRVGRIIGD